MPALHNPLAQFNKALWLTLGIFILFVLAFGLYVRSEKAIDHANDVRTTSLRLAGELRQSSDDLTRMVHTYVVTGDPAYKRHYQEIIDIRDGRKPRPVDYQNVYWDLVLQDGRRPRPDGEPVALLELMRREGFTEAEFAKLAEAKSRSDALTRREFSAMQLIEAAGPQREANRERAIAMLYDAAYLQAKADIMEPIAEFNAMVDRRTNQAVRSAENAATLLRLLLVSLGGLLVLSLWRVHRIQHATLGGKIDEIHAHISRLGRGDFSDTISVPEHRRGSILGWLAEMQARLRDTEAERQEQRDRIARLVRIYAVLSGINSAIVRIHERQDLLDAACRVAVEDGQFGMAWIGLLDPDGRALRPVAGYGIDLAAIRDLPVSTGAEAPAGQGTAYEALTSRRAAFCNDITLLPQIGPVRALALEHDYRSVCALPLIVDGAGIGVMGLYAREAGFFDAQEMKLLDELAADISFALQYIEREERLHYLAYYDGLTGLPNRSLFLDRLAQLIHGSRDENHTVAALLLDLDHFTHINETYGRHIGDTLLKQVAMRLDSTVREPCSMARVGADTFAVAVSGLQQGAESAITVQKRVLDALGQPFCVEGNEIRIAVHAGVALYPDDATDAESLHRCAEAALREAQASNRRCLYYAPEINARIAANLAMERELRIALDTGQFVMHYQPRVDLMSGAMVGAEALIRWQHPERGLVPPGEFIPLAEHTGLIVPIGAWVIDTVCAQQAAWLAAGIEIVPVAANLSPVQFAHDNLLPTLEAALARHSLDARYLELELTESLVMQNPEEAALTMSGFRGVGLRLSLDDFGTGYSSLAYLQRFPFDFVKIDRAFVSNITHNPADAAIATAVIAMAHRLNLRVVAEGVETEGQLCYLREHGCDQIQGYYFSPPVPAETFAGMLRSARHLPAVPADPDVEDRTLLVVDDEPSILSALHRTLRREGYRVFKAASAEEGLEILATTRVQVIVSDQRMPGMSGSAFLSIVKELYPETIRIILSGYTDLESVTDAVNRGAVYKFLTKPWEDELLKENIRDAFRRYQPPVHDDPPREPETAG